MTALALRAAWVLPISAPPVRDGIVLLYRDKIVAVGPASGIVVPEGTEVRDLGEAAILPGLVNAHSHLELTVMRGLLEDSDFRKWVEHLTNIRQNQMAAEDVIDSARIGALEAIASGVTCLGDTGDSGAALDALEESGLGGVVFQETFGLAPEQAADGLVRLRERFEALRARQRAPDRVAVGVSPHAPYTISGPLFRLVTEYALAERSPMAIHTAESAAEEQLMWKGAGVFADRFAERGIRWVAPETTTIGYLSSLGVLEARPLLIHCVQATDADLALAAEAGCAMAHCPKSNAKFGHGMAPLPRMLAHGVSVGLGTDSVGSNNVMDLLDEARAATLFARAASGNPEALSARGALELATLGGARALGLGEVTGSLEAGKRADLCAVSLRGVHARPVFDVETALVFSCSARDVVLTVASGRILYDAGAEAPFATLDTGRLHARADEIAARIS